VPFSNDQVLNLMDMERQATNPLEQGIAMSFAKHMSALDIVPWKSINTTKVRWLRRDGPLARPSYTNPNSGARKVKSALKEQAETLYYLSADIDVDYRLLQDKNIMGNIRAEETDAMIEGLAQVVTNSFFWGDENVPVDQDEFGNDVYEPTGIITRIRAGTAKGYDPSLRRNANGADISPTGFSSQDGYKILRKIDEVAARMNKGDRETGNKVGGKLFCDIEFYSALGDMMRRSGGFKTVQDNYDREVETLHGFAITIVGQKVYSLDQDVAANKTLRWTDSAGVPNDSGNYQSIVFAKIGEGYVEGLQVEPMNVEDIGRVSGTRILRTMFDWTFGFRAKAANSIAEIYGIKLR
jgi:hypothetical protein